MTGIIHFVALELTTLLGRVIDKLKCVGHQLKFRYGGLHEHKTLDRRNEIGRTIRFVSSVERGHFLPDGGIAQRR